MTQQATAKLPPTWKKSIEEASEEDKRRLSRYLKDAEKQFYKDEPSGIEDKWAYIADIALRRFYGTGGPKSTENREEVGLPTSNVNINLASLFLRLSESIVNG